MPLPADKVELLIGGWVVDGAIIGGHMHDDWESYEIDSDLLTPADAWHLTLGVGAGERSAANTTIGLPAEVTAGAPVQVKIGGSTVLTGRIDEITHRVDKRSHTLTLSGRDGAAVLVDCSAPVFVARLVSLDEIMVKVVRPLGITKTRLDADATRRREKINVEPGDTAWEVLAHAAEANGLWPWFEPDGTLVVGGPDYSKPPVGELILRYNGQGNNVLSLDLRRGIAERYSHLTVLGQTHGTSQESGKHALSAAEKDEEMAAIAYRPKIVVDHESDNAATARDRARKLLSDARLRGFTLTATVKGHRLLAPGTASDGVLWTPGQRLRVRSEPHGIEAIFFLMGRKFCGGKGCGATTELTLKEDGVWTLDAHPHKLVHRRGKNWAGELLDVTGTTP